MPDEFSLALPTDETEEGKKKSRKDRERFLDAYKEMTRKTELRFSLTEPLRTMRMVHFTVSAGPSYMLASYHRRDGVGGSFTDPPRS